MRVHTNYVGLDGAAGGVCLAIGRFDGVHRGHRAVIAEAQSHAQAIGARLGVLTFDPSPAQHFNPDKAPAHLMNADQRIGLFTQLGVDHLFVLPFDASFASMTADDFVARVLVGALRVSAVAVGSNFRFGAGRQGDCDRLAELGAKSGFSVLVASQTEYGGARISSSLIRQSITHGDMVTAASLLGRPWTVEAHVQRGLERGRTIGFPTANLDLGDYVRPAHGVYAVWVAHETEQNWHPAVANYGRAPTLGGRSPLLEAHIFDRTVDLYDQRLMVGFCDFVRPERAFASVDDLAAQIASDSQMARQILANHESPPDTIARTQ